MKNINEMTAGELTTESQELFELLERTKIDNSFDSFYWNGLNYNQANNRYMDILERIFNNAFSSANDIFKTE